jgi:hypothetical protein
VAVGVQTSQQETVDSIPQLLISRHRLIVLEVWNPHFCYLCLISSFSCLFLSDISYYLCLQDLLVYLAHIGVSHIAAFL